MTDRMDDVDWVTEGGWLPPGPVQVELHPDEHIVGSSDIHARVWRCRRPAHEGRGCWTRITDTADPFDDKPNDGGDLT